jgi:aquaporin Z
MLIHALLAELIGSFLFYVVILTTGQPIAIAVALLAAIYFGGHISGGHYNALVTLMMILRGDVTFTTGVLYVLMQTFAALFAFAWYKQTGKMKVRYA